MANVVLISASPAEPSKTEALLEFVALRLNQHGHRTEFLKLRHLPAGPLLAGDANADLIASARATVTDADAVVVDFGLKPLLVTLGASSIGRGRFVNSNAILPATESTRPRIDETVELDVVDAIDRFDSELSIWSRLCSHAEAGDPASVLSAPTTTDRNPS